MAAATMDDLALAARLKELDLGVSLDDSDRIDGIGGTSSGLTDEGLQFVKGLAHLKELHVSDTKVTGKGLVVVLTLPRLERLACSPQVDADEALSYIGQVTGLRHLTLAGSRISDSGLASLSHLLRLEYLSVAKTDVGPGVAVVEQFPKLTQLNLVDTKVDDAVLESVGRVRTLRKLWLEHQAITDVGLRHLRNLTELESFGFDGTVTAAGLAYLGGLPKLDTLYMEAVKGLDSKCIDVLIGMTQLSEVILREGEVEADEVTRFHKQRPDCELTILRGRKPE